MAEFGLVLSSDGSKSSFEIGAWKALRELNVKISAVSGSFVGALNAALIAQGDFEKAVKFWRNVYSKNLFYINKSIAQKYTDEWSKNETRQFRKSFISYVGGRTEELAPLKDMIEMFVDEKVVRASATDMGFVSISLSNLEAEMITLGKIPRGKLSQYLLAAACFPQIAQVNRAKDPQFSMEYSPYRIVHASGTAQILSTDEILAIPPNFSADIHIIHSSEVMEFSLTESVEKMKSNIKHGYIDTLRMFEESLGQVYFIKPGDNLSFQAFKAKLGSELPAHLNELARILLRVRVLSVESATIRLSALIEEGGINYADLYVALLENMAKFTGVKNDEKYTLDMLLGIAVSTSKILLEEAKRALVEGNGDDIREILDNITEPGRNLPDPPLFMKYFLMLISAKPEKYMRFRDFLVCLNPKTSAALVCLLYAYYA
jgi:NTE family protein